MSSKCIVFISNIRHRSWKVVYGKAENQVLFGTFLLLLLESKTLTLLGYPSWLELGNASLAAAAYAPSASLLVLANLARDPKVNWQGFCGSIVLITVIKSLCT